MTIGVKHDLLLEGESLYDEVTGVIFKILSQQFPEKEYQLEALEAKIFKLVRVCPSKMRDVLNSVNIETMEDLVDHKEKFDKIGTPIPGDLISLLVDDPFLQVRHGQIVAYKSEGDGFIFAEVEEDEEDVNPSKLILINIGNQTRRVKLLDIFFFPLTFPGESGDGDRTLEVFEGDAESELAEDGKFQDLQKVYEEIRQQLEENYQKLEDDQKSWQKFVKRLLFKWHPDKNPDNMWVKPLR